MRPVVCKPKLGRSLGLDKPSVLGKPVEPERLEGMRLPEQHGTERPWRHLLKLGPVAKPGPWWLQQPERLGQLERPVRIQRKRRPGQLGRPVKSEQLGPVWLQLQPGLVGQLE